MVGYFLGWDEGVVTMKVGEKATLDITRYLPTYPWFHILVDTFGTEDLD